MIRIHPPKHIAEIIHGPLNGVEPPGFAREIIRAMLKEVWSMGLPSMTGFLVISLYELINMFWLAKIGAAPVAAVTMVASFLFMLAFPNMIVGPGSVATISRRFGENDAVRTERAIKNTFVLKFGIGVLLGIPGIILLPAVLDFMGAAPDVRELGIHYGTLQMAVLGFALTSYSVYTALRSIGQPRAALWIQVLGAGVNCILDPLLIFGWGPFPELGIAGAALATACAHVSVVITGCIALESKRSPVRVRWLKRPWPDLPEMIQMMKIGFPAGINQLSFAAAMSVAVKMVSGYGTVVVAIYGMSNKVLHFAVMTVVGLGLGTGSLVGQLLGSRDLHKAWLAGVLSIRIAFWIMLGACVGIIACAPYIVRLFFTDPAVTVQAQLILRIMALSLPFIGIHIGSETVFEGSGQNTPPMILAIVHSWVMVVPFMYLSGVVFEWGPLAVMGSWGLAHCLGGLAALWLFRRGSWLKHEF
jgi:putative MATE family efflux protein